MNLPNQPQSAVEIIKTGLRLWKRTFRQVLPFALLAMLTPMVFNFLINASFSSIDSTRLDETLTGMDFTKIIALIGSLMLTILLLCMAVQFILNVAIILRIDQTVNNKKMNFMTLLSFGCKKAFPSLIAFVVLGFLIFLSGVVLIIPGIIAAIYFGFSPFMVILSNETIIGSFKKSYALTRGFWWHTFIVTILTVFIILMIVLLSCLVSIVIAFGMLMLQVLQDGNSHFSFDNSLIVNALSIMIICPFWFCCRMALFSDLKIRQALK